MSTKWVSTKVMAEHLEVSTKTLQRWRTEGLLKLGIHWRRKFPKTKRYLLYNLELVERVLINAGSIEL